MKKRILSMLLAIVMVVSLLPGVSLTASAASENGFSDHVSDSAEDDGVALSKSVTYDPETGKVTTVIEAYTTGTVTLTNVTKPTDIILVLDVSGSMDYSFSGENNGSGERLAAMKDAVNSFIDQTAAQNSSQTNPSEMHSIAIVTFASESNVRAGFTDVNSTGAQTLKNVVSGLQANGATAVDYGLEDAADLLTDRAAANNGAYAEREKVVIVFTDGDPTHGSSYDDEVAHDAVNSAQMIKSTGAKIYSIGIFNGANASGTDESNIFMNYVSSNYPKAYGYTETEYVFIFPVTNYLLAPGAEPYYTGHYMTANNASSLNNIFSTISSQIGKPDVELGSSATLIDVVSDYFTIEGLGSTPTITAQTSEYLGNGSWAAPVTDPAVDPVLTGTDTITVNGFDFDNNYISETARDGFYGKKLILTFVTIPNYDEIDETGSFADASIPTNDTAALLDSEGNAVEYVPSPTLTANTVTYQVVDSTTRTIATYYRLPGSTVTLLDKPADTAQYTYSAWTTQDAALNGSTFTMPAKDVVLTSTGTTKTYTVYYTYTGNIPTGADPAAAPTAATYSVGATVTHPTVTAPAGYTFSGWTEDDGDITGDSFVMPAEDLHFEGHFIASANSYTVEHYLMDTDGNYPETPDHENVYDGVKTGDAVTATIADHTGFTFDEDNENNVLSGTVLADGKLVLKVYYERNKFPVTYQYDGTVPEGADPTEEALEQAPYVGTFYYGQTVAIQPDAAAAGYTFSGWRIYTGDTAITDGKMVMPNSDVVLTGHFAPIPAKYTVEHYLEDANGGYPAATPYTTEFSVGVYVGNTVTGVPNTYNTYTYDPVKTAGANAVMTDVAGVSVPSGEVTADGKLILKLYYTRNAYNITYRFENNPGNIGVPSGHSNVKHGTVVDLADVIAPAGYTFDGWYYGTEKVGDSLTMPREDVELVGRFTANSGVPYAVKYYLQNVDGNGYTEDTSSSYTAAGTTGDYVVAATKEFTGFSFDTSKGAWNGHIKGDGSLVLELYYNRNSYTVSYYYFGTPPTDTAIFMGGESLTISESNPLIVTEKVLYGAAKTVRPVLTASDGKYEFSGWYTANLPGVPASRELSEGTSYTMPAHNVEFRGALYNYTVYYDLNGGTLNGKDVVEPKEVNWNDADLLPEGTPVKDNMIFIGWSHESKTAYVTDSDKYSDLAATPDVEVIILKAEYVNGYTVTYDWGTENIPTGVTLPTDSGLYAEGDTYTVDTTYPEGYTVETKDSYGNVTGVYTFSGWDKNGTITVTGDVLISGSWTYTEVGVDTWTVTYEWTNAPDSVTKPETVTGIVNGTLYTVDTTYTSATEIPVRDLFNNIIGYWSFSGWDKSGTLTVTDNIIISGSWTYEKVDVPVIPPIIPIGTAELIKVDAEDNSTVLSGVVFELYRANGTHIGTYMTDENGEIRVSDLVAGSYYWLEIRSAEGYVLDDSKHTFTVPAWQTVSVVIENSKSEVPGAFGDDHYAYIIGYDDGLVHPEANITRAEVATIFFRLLSAETRNQYMTRENIFSDVDQGDWYNTAVSTMAAMGIVTGRPDGSFDPNANITRAEFAAIAARFDKHGNTSDASFTDIYEHWAKKEISIAANNGWVLGYEDGAFRPDQYITRAEAMTMVNRVLQRIPESVDDLLPDMVVWPDNMDTEKWYYLMVQEATNSHYYERKVNGYEYWLELREVPDWTIYEK
ncbi:MAG: S-layer homology domain-containing protein [Clostridia bacterium]|nr:S-layer homology domain-containing protein [Clostridia bacterium]